VRVTTQQDVGLRFGVRFGLVRLALQPVAHMDGD
jgi:hypothetical protein